MRINEVLIWMSVTIAISVGIICTGDIRCLWFMLLPTLYSFSSDNKHNGGDN